MNGVETLRELLAGDATLRIHIVTAFHLDFMQGLQAARAEGLAFELARKPLGAEEIRMIVDAVLSEGLDAATGAAP